MSTTAASPPSADDQQDGPASSTAPQASTSNPVPGEPKKEILALLPSESDPSAIGLDMSTGESTIKLDHLGPMVVHVDGTMSRIANWAEMAEIEKKNTLRIIAKRNKERLDELKKKKEKEGGE
jgi:hypothetical protein